MTILIGIQQGTRLRIRPEGFIRYVMVPIPEHLRRGESGGMLEFLPRPVGLHGGGVVHDGHAEDLLLEGDGGGVLG